MTEEPASLILELLRQMRAELATKDNLESVRAEVSDVRSEVADIKSDLRTLRADVAADLVTTRKELGEQIVGLRRAVIDYHTSAIGHGVIISELEARVRRVEQHLNLPSLHPTYEGLSALGRWIIRRTLLRLRAPLLDHLHRDHRALVEQQHRQGERGHADEVRRGEDGREPNHRHDRIAPHPHEIGGVDDADVAEKSQNDRELEGYAEGEDERHDERQIFAHFGQKLDRRFAGNVDLLQRHRKTDQKRHHDEIDEQRAEQEEERGRDQIGPKGLPLVAVEARRDKLVDLNGNDRKSDDRRPEHAEPDVGVKLLEKMGGDQRRLFRAHHPHIGIREYVVDRAGKIEADDKGGQEGIEGPDNASPELDQMVHQRRLGGVDVLLAHSAALLCADGSGSASLSAGATVAAGSGPVRAISGLSISDLPISGVAASEETASGTLAEVATAFVTSSRIMPTGSKLVSIFAWSLIA